MTRDLPLLSAFTRYLLMPIAHDYSRWRDPNNPLRHLVRWESPFSYEWEGEEGQSWDDRGMIVRERYCAPFYGHFRDHRHYTLEEFKVKVRIDERFRRLVGL
jgi:hypothetical protein